MHGMNGQGDGSRNTGLGDRRGSLPREEYDATTHELHDGEQRGKRCITINITITIIILRHYDE